MGGSGRDGEGGERPEEAGAVDAGHRLKITPAVDRANDVPPRLSGYQR
jgi:hypothetical protein